MDKLPSDDTKQSPLNNMLFSISAQSDTLSSSCSNAAALSLPASHEACSSCNARSSSTPDARISIRRTPGLHFSIVEFLNPTASDASMTTVWVHSSHCFSTSTTKICDAGCRDFSPKYRCHVKRKQYYNTYEV